MIRRPSVDEFENLDWLVAALDACRAERAEAEEAETGEAGAAEEGGEEE